MKRAISNNICSFCNVQRFSSDSFTQLRIHFSSSTVVLPLKYLCNNSTETFAEKQKFRQKINPTSSNRVILYYIKTVTFLLLFRSWQQNLSRKFEFTGFRININQFYINFVTLFNSGFFHCFQTFPVYFRNVQQTVLTRQKFD